jgi:hypothetical protein
MRMDQSPIRYRFALDCRNRVIEVSSLVPEARRDGGPFTCVGCSTELIPRLGQKKAKHFAHKQTIECSRETYLHSLAKLTFCQEFEKCVAAGIPLILERRIPVTCNACEEGLGIACNESEEESIDLTAQFQKAIPEAPWGGYVADVLLSSSVYDQVVFVEFNVSHPCSSEKIGSEHRILEIRVEDEDDIERIRTHRIDCEEKCSLFNFRTKAVSRPLHGDECSKAQFIVFIVFKSGKCLLKPCGIKQAKQMMSTEARQRFRYTSLIHKAVPELYELYEPHRLFQAQVERAYFARIPLRNCNVCKYRGYSTKGAVFCMIRRENLGSNSAASCVNFSPVRSRAEQAAVERKIASFLRAAGR